MINQSNPFGLLAFLHWNDAWNNWHFTEELVQKAAAQITDLGVGMVRLDIVWSDIHRGPGQYDFSRYDSLINLLKKQGFDLLIMLHYNKNRLNAQGQIVWNQPPESFEEFAAYVGATVDRYKQTIHHWEIWNEPNHPDYWSWPKNKLADYIRLLDLSYKAAKKADPNCVILNGGITEPIIEDVGNFYAQGGKNCSDILAIHTFLNPLAGDYETQFDNILTGVRRVMRANNDTDKKIWITEMGCPGIPASKQVKDWWAGKNSTEAQQAEWVEKQYAMMEKYPFVEKIFWAFYRDTENIFNDGSDYLGLVRFDLSPKPSFFSMQKIIKNYKQTAHLPLNNR